MIRSHKRNGRNYVWQVLCRYCHYIDRSSMSDVAGLFHPEAEFVFPPNTPAAGREAILESLEEWDKTARRPTAWLRHRIDTPMIKVEATGRLLFVT